MRVGSLVKLLGKLGVVTEKNETTGDFWVVWLQGGGAWFGSELLEVVCK